MPDENHAYLEDWVRIARKDLGRAERLLEQDDPALAGFCLQQAVEKFLKAFLLSRGWRLRKTRDLERLLDDAIHYEPALTEFRRICQRVTGYYIAERYPPSLGGEVTEEDVRSSFDQAKALIEKLRSELA